MRKNNRADGLVVPRPSVTFELPPDGGAEVDFAADRDCTLLRITIEPADGILVTCDRLLTARDVPAAVLAKMSDLREPMRKGEPFALQIHNGGRRAVRGVVVLDLLAGAP